MDGKIISVVLMLSIAGALLVNSFVSYPLGSDSNNSMNETTKIKKFNSPEEIKTFLETNSQTEGTMRYFGMSLDMGGPMMLKAVPMMAVEESISGSVAPSPRNGADDFSSTNIQVAGVDEADVVKNDGRYLYVLSGNVLSIVDAYPPEDATLLSQIHLKSNPQELYINGDKLIILGNDYNYIDFPAPLESSFSKMVAEEIEPYPDRVNAPRAVLYVYNIEDRENPELVRDVFVDGNYLDSRMIGDFVYVIATQHAWYYDDFVTVPQISGSGMEKPIEPDVYHFDEPDSYYSFTTIVSVNTQDLNDDVNGKIYLLGSAQNLFVSLNNVYITYQKRIPEPYLIERIVDTVVEPLIPMYISAEIDRIQNSDKPDFEKGADIENVIVKYFDSLSDSDRRKLQNVAEERIDVLEYDLVKETERTLVHKISIEKGKIEYEASGDVPGQVLNQFSMDEYQGFFRIATTTGQVSRRGGSLSANHIYVLDDNLEIAGELEDLAPGEKIYSARFMGKRVYLVTFQKVDPLFVIDLSNPEEPSILGKLKIPGYSDYLHPYDENHVIGIGKDAVEAEEGNFAWYQGIKIALFDVSNVNKPKEISNYVIGDRGTDSPALHDHKAFLFSKDKNLLVIPVLLAEIDYEKYPEELPKWTHGDYVWQGAYVFHIDHETGLKLRGRVSHDEGNEDFLKSGRYYFGGDSSIKRSLYIDDTLYTVSDVLVKMNDLKDLNEINRVRLEK
jgi:uncharacterized secreted protein with C-terminal beta-propeller domain